MPAMSCSLVQPARSGRRVPTENPVPAGQQAPADRLATALPLLRRYARAATGSQSTGDALVRETLEAALADRQVLARIAANATGLYGAFSSLWHSLDPQAGRLPVAAGQPLASQLGRLPGLMRQALLLNQLEDFSIAETAEILAVSETEAGRLVDEGLGELARDGAADVLIIEDEPLIAGHLEEIVSQAGHRVIATAVTAAEARALFELYRPTLVLCDIQLADGSSGIDAVADILRIGPVPVIFITAFPEKLLIMDWAEPAFLITKPFREETVRTTIRQALFFGSSLQH